MIKDRGTIKWTALMLPEHVSMIKDFWKDTEKVKKPTLDDQELLIINNTIYEAFTCKEKLSITYYDSGIYNIFIGHIHKLDHIHRQIHVKDFFGESLVIDVDNIVKVNKE